MSEEIRHASGRESVSEEHTPTGRRYVSMMWTLVAAVAVICVLLALMYRFHNNATSTVNPHKDQPASN